MKSKFAELREPTCCCIGVRKLTFALAFIQASTLFFSLGVIAFGLLRNPSSLASGFGYYVADGELSLVSVSVRGDVYAETIAVEFVSSNKLRDEIFAPESAEPQTADEVIIVGNPFAVANVEPNEPVVNGIQLHIVEQYEVAAVPPCHAWREVLLVLVLLSISCCFTVLALVGVLRVKPTYLLPYCCVHLCDLVLTAGALVTACTYMRTTREWISMQRYVTVDDSVHERLLRLSESELHAVLVLAGTIVFGLKALWFSTVCRCYSYLVKLYNRRLLDGFGLVASSMMPFGADHECDKVAMLVPFEEKTDPTFKQFVHPPDNVDEKRPLSPPPAFDEVPHVNPI